MTERRQSRSHVGGVKPPPPPKRQPPPPPVEAYSSDEPPTLALSRPILNLLASETATPQSEDAPAEEIALPAPPLLEAATESRPDAVPVALEVTPPPVQSEMAPVASAGRAPSSRVGFAIGTWVGVAAALSVAGWLGLRYGVMAPTPLPATAPLPAAPMAAPARAPELSEAKALVTKPASPTLAPVEVEATSRTTERLLTADGSEATAPTCEALLQSPFVDADPRSGFDDVGAARRALVRGDVDSSQRWFCRAVNNGDAEATAAFELAQLLLLRRDPKAAAEWAQRAARLEPSSSRVLALLADTLLRTGELAAAREALRASAKLGQDDDAGFERLLAHTLEDAEASLKKLDPARAERLSRRVLAFQPTNGEAHDKLARALSRLGFTKSAELWSSRRVELTRAAASDDG